MTEDTAAIRRARVLSAPLKDASAPRAFFGGTFASYREIWQRRELTRQLARREIRAKYKNSSLGVVWSLFKPLAQLLVYYFAVGQVLGVARSIPGFAVFVFVGLTGWTLFTEIVSRSTTSIVSNAGLIKKVYLPREVFPFASVLGALFNTGIQLLVLVVALVAFRQVPTSWEILYAVLGFALILVFGTAVGLLLAAANVFLRDFEHLVEVALVILFWASPIVYSFSFVHNFLQGNWLETLYLSNPVTLAILGMQRGLWTAGKGTDAGQWPDDLGVMMAIALGLSLALLWFSQRMFARFQGSFAQEL